MLSKSEILMSLNSNKSHFARLRFFSKPFLHLYASHFMKSVKKLVRSTLNLWLFMFEMIIVIPVGNCSLLWVSGI